MEATGVYWKAPYYALEGLFEELRLCNAQHVKNVPGRKTDLSDAEWLADVAAHGMVREGCKHAITALSSHDGHLPG
jgi:transposase